MRPGAGQDGAGAAAARCTSGGAGCKLRAGRFPHVSLAYIPGWHINASSHQLVPAAVHHAGLSAAHAAAAATAGGLPPNCKTLAVTAC